MNVPASDSDSPAIVVRHRLLLLVGIMTATLLQVLDSTIANVALPHMQASLGATRDSVSWVLTSYIIASSVALPATGWLRDRFGTRALLITSVAGFVVTSVLCGLALNLATMVLFRLLQGLVGTFIVPLAQAVMMDVTPPSQQHTVLALYGCGVMVGPIAGPVLGGFLTENFDWRWVFFVNVPVGAAALALLAWLLPATPRTKSAFDVPGWIFLAVGLAAFQLLLDRGQHVDWFDSTEIWIEAGVAVCAFWMFGVQAFTSDNPLFPVRLLGNVNCMVGAFLSFVMAMTAIGGSALMAPMLQQIFGYSSLQAGELLACRGLGVLGGMLVGGRIAAHFDPRLLIGLGFLLSGVAAYSMTQWSIEMDWHPFVYSGAFLGLGFGLIFVPLNAAAFATLPLEERTRASSLMNLARNSGASVGIAILTFLFARNAQISHSDLASALRLPMDPGLLSGFGLSGQSVLMALDAMISRQAAMIAYLDDFQFLMYSLLGAIPLAFLIRRAKGRVEAPSMFVE